MLRQTTNILNYQVNLYACRPIIGTSLLPGPCYSNYIAPAPKVISNIQDEFASL